VATQEYCPVADNEALRLRIGLLPDTTSGISFNPYQLIVGEGFPSATQGILVWMLSSTLTVKFPGQLVN